MGRKFCWCCQKCKVFSLYVPANHGVLKALVRNGNLFRMWILEINAPPCVLRSYARALMSAL